MKNIKIFIFLAIIILGAAAGKLSAQTNPGVDSAAVREIEVKVFKKLINLPYYGVFDHISYRVKDDTVTLSGKVARARNKTDAEDAVEKIAGVRRIINDIEILPPSPFDDRIRLRVLRALAAKSLFRYLQEPTPLVRLIVDGGRLTLEGFVANRGDYNLMNVLANGVSDVFSVTNNLIIENGRLR